MPGHSEALIEQVAEHLTDAPQTVRDIHKRIDGYAEGSVRNALAELVRRHKAHKTVEPNTTNHIRSRYWRA